MVTIYYKATILLLLDGIMPDEIYSVEHILTDLRFADKKCVSAMNLHNGKALMGTIS